MKKIMTLACSVLLALGLAACDNEEVEETPSGGDESSETVPDTGTTDTTTEGTHPGYVICGDLEGIDSWTNEPDKTSDFYLSTASGETHWERTITGLAEDNGYCGFRVLTYGEWDSVCGASELTSDSTGVSTNSNDIIITDGVTYDLVIDISDTAKSIKVTEVVAEEPTTGYAITYAEEQTAVSAADSKMYYWVDEGENHVDPVDGENYYDEGVYHIAYTVEEGLSPVWYGVQLFMELSAEDKEAATLSTGDEYYVSFTISSTVSGSITVNGNEVEISAGETEVNVKSTTTLEQDASYWADYGYTDETTGEEAGEWIETTAATLRVQLGVDPDTFLGEVTLAISDLTFTKVEPEEGTETLTTGGIEALHSETDGLMHYYIEYEHTLNEATHYLETDTYVLDWTNAGSDWWGFQIMMMLTSEQLTSYGLTEGGMYTLTFNLKSSVAHDITVLGDEITLTEGDNSIEVVGIVNSTTGDYCTFHIWAGTETSGLITEGRFEISDINFEEYEAPEEWEHEYVVDLANAAPTTGDEFKEEGSVPSDGKFYYWNDQNWCGSYVTVTNFGYDSTNGGFVIAYSSSGSCWYGMQVWLDFPSDHELYSAFTASSSYEIELSYTSSVAGEITLHHEAVEYDIIEGSSTITDIVAGTSGTTFCIAFGAEHLNDDNESTMISEIEFVITGLTFRF